MSIIYFITTQDIDTFQKKFTGNVIECRHHAVSAII
ncbi:Uncharacterised protein [Salmonella enterica subsp. enterica]|uniref:Uncharacterized protein n=1 Tax=Salmonella enterica I TaxID=59201 RepID=A0A3S4ISD2_SALET|nr:Uncharacterised protein [Salmonella enterica subsp. enterica]